MRTEHPITVYVGREAYPATLTILAHGRIRIELSRNHLVKLNSSAYYGHGYLHEENGKWKLEPHYISENNYGPGRATIYRAGLLDMKPAAPTHREKIENAIVAAANREMKKEARQLEMLRATAESHASSVSGAEGKVERLEKELAEAKRELAAAKKTAAESESAYHAARKKAKNNG